VTKRSLWRRLGVVAIVAAAGVQLVPVERGNPPVDEGARLSAPLEVAAVLRRACFDCHSHETIWPWYAHVAPVSWLVARDVEEGREELNFSTWNGLAADRRASKLHEVVEKVQQGEMPPAIYLPLHPEARLGEAERALLVGWAEGAAAAAGIPGSAAPEAMAEHIPPAGRADDGG
jgi:hypothetical protein